MSSLDVSGLASGFWEVGNYRHNIRRIRDGVEQLDDFTKMCKERAEIEAKYAKSLQSFNERWSAHFERSMHSGSVKTALLDVVSESDALATQHLTVRDRLLEEIVKTVALFRKENHHPSAFRAPKEIRETEEAFEKAQRQWKKLYEKMETAKKAYFSACRTEKSAQVLLANAMADTAVSQDGTQKMKERHEKAQEEVRKTRSIYESLLNEITTYKGPYIENMSFVFAKCQQMEMKRMKFFLEMIAGVQHVLVDLIRNSKFSSLHSNIEQILKTTDDTVLDRDLNEWSSVYGVESTTNWPVFEQYRLEMRQISGRKESAKDNGGVILTRQIIKTDEIAVPGPASSNGSEQEKNSDSDSNTFDSRNSSTKDRRPIKSNINGPTKTWDSSSSVPQSRTPDSEKFSEFDDYVQKSLATVLYDYSPIENDEIALKKGETIEILSEPDTLGWCTGRKNGNTGLFPASYVQVV